jgi:hypothetical protein
MLRALKAKNVALGGVIAVTGLLASCGSPTGQGLPRDWSDGHYLYQYGVKTSITERVGTMNDPRRYLDWQRRTRPKRNPPIPRGPVGDVDWNVSLGGGTLVDGAFPAKYGYNPTVAESCSGDWVVYGTNVAGTTKVPNIVAYTNVYPSPTCSGTVPTLKFAYYVAGPITTSPVISLDGTKIAFVEGAYNGTTAKFHVVSTSGAGKINAPVVPPSNTSIDLGSSDTQSSPFVDYTNDIAYVGTDDGNLHKITGVFTSTTPTATGSPWPVQLSAPLAGYGAYALLTSPVVYNPTGSGLGIALIAGNYLVSTSPVNGYETLFSVNLNTAASLSSTLRVGAVSVSDGPMVDVTNNVAYLFSGNSNSKYGTTGPAAIEQVALKYSNSTFSFGAVTQATMGSVSTPTVVYGTYNIDTNPIHSGSFDNAWYTSTNGTGYLLGCGTGKTGTPTLYSFPVSGGTLTTTTAGSTAVSTSTSDLCSPVTQSYDGSTDRFFVGTQKSGIKCSSGGCIQDFTLSAGVPQAPTVGQPETGGTSAIVVDADTGTTSYIYFTTLSSTGNPAIQLSQQALK